MPEDRSPRRRPEKQTDQTARRRAVPWRLILAALPLVLAAVSTVVLLRTSVLTVQQVHVTGVEILDPSDLAQISGLRGKSMLDLPLSQASANLLAIPQVKTVSFQRNWPQGVTVRVQERLPAAFWSVGGQDYVVDDDGVVLEAGAPSGPAPLIVEPNSNRVMGPGDRVQPDAVALAERIFEEAPTFLGQSVSRLEYQDDVGVTAVFGSGLRVTFGDDRSYDFKVAVLSQLLNTLSAKGVVPHDVDLRFGERVTYD